MKQHLLSHFLAECRQLDITIVHADSLEGMDNNKFFLSQGFVFEKTEPVTDDLDMMWYRLEVQLKNPLDKEANNI